jgi:hypothetical protein
MSTGKIVNEIKIARQRSKHCKKNSSSWSAAESPISHPRVPYRARGRPAREGGGKQSDRRACEPDRDRHRGRRYGQSRLIEQDGVRYQNGEPAAAFLAGKPGPDLRPMLRFFDQISYPTWQKLADAVRTGNGQAQFGKFDKRQQEIFLAGVESFSGPGAATLATNYDFGRHRKVLDVAGGRRCLLNVRFGSLFGLKASVLNRFTARPNFFS